MVWLVVRHAEEKRLFAVPSQEVDRPIAALVGEGILVGYSVSENTLASSQLSAGPKALLGRHLFEIAAHVIPVVGIPPCSDATTPERVRAVHMSLPDVGTMVFS